MIVTNFYCFILAKNLNGIQSESADGAVLNARTQCNTDSFSVSSPGNPAPPVICGYNTGEHSNTYLFECGLTKANTYSNPVNYSVCRCL